MQERQKQTSEIKKKNKKTKNRGHNIKMYDKYVFYLSSTEMKMKRKNTKNKMSPFTSVVLHNYISF